MYPAMHLPFTASLHLVYFSTVLDYFSNLYLPLVIRHNIKSCMCK